MQKIHIVHTYKECRHICNNRSHNALLLIFMFGKYRVHIWMNILVTIGFFRRRIPICKCTSTLCIFFTQKVFFKVYYLCCWCWPSMSLSSREMSLFWRHWPRCSKSCKKVARIVHSSLKQNLNNMETEEFFFLKKMFLHIFFVFRALCVIAPNY